MPILLTWSLATDARGLVIDYRVENTTGSSVWLLDEVVVGSAKGYLVEPERVLVRFDPDAKQVVFVIGQLAPKDMLAKNARAGVASETMPVAHELAANATTSGTKRVATPLVPWHPDLRNVSMMAAMTPSPSEARLELHYVQLPSLAIGRPAWRALPSASGGTIEVADDQLVRLGKKIVVADALRIP
jgi:hypothetical protein